MSAPPNTGTSNTGRRQLKLGAVTYGAGGPGMPCRWLDEDIPAGASVNITWHIEQARLAGQARDRDFSRALAELGRPFAWHDFRQYDLDAPFPPRVFGTTAVGRARAAKPPSANRTFT